MPTESVNWLDTTPPAHAENRSLVLFDKGDEIMVHAGADGVRFLLVSGKPLGEPVAWYGPIVMNTQQQLQEAFYRTSRRDVPKELGIGDDCENGKKRYQSDRKTFGYGLR